MRTGVHIAPFPGTRQGRGKIVGIDRAVVPPRWSMMQLETPPFTLDPPTVDVLAALVYGDEQPEQELPPRGSEKVYLALIASRLISDQIKRAREGHMTGEEAGRIIDWALSPENPNAHRNAEYLARLVTVRTDRAEETRGKA